MIYWKADENQKNVNLFGNLYYKIRAKEFWDHTNKCGICCCGKRWRGCISQNAQPEKWDDIQKTQHMVRFHIIQMKKRRSISNQNIQNLRMRGEISILEVIHLVETQVEEFLASRPLSEDGSSASNCLIREKINNLVLG